MGGGTAVYSGWRDSTIDVDLSADDDAIFRDVQDIKQRLQLNIEFARPEDFVPSLSGSGDRHVFIDTIDRVSFHHYDPYSQLLSKVVRGFNRDVQDASTPFRVFWIESHGRDAREPEAWALTSDTRPRRRAPTPAH